MHSKTTRSLCALLLLPFLLGGCGVLSTTLIKPEGEILFQTPTENSGKPLIDRKALKNPVVDIEGWAVKDACMIWHEDYFYIFSSAFFFEDGM